MIGLDQAASVWCDHPGCVAVQRARLVLNSSGGFAPLPESTAWELLVAANGTVLVRCPKHSAKARPVPKRKGRK